MQINSVRAYAIKVPNMNGNQGDRPDVERYGDYTIAADAWTSIYSNHHETCLVRIETDTGLVGWGEGQAPVSPRADGGDCGGSVYAAAVGARSV